MTLMEKQQNRTRGQEILMISEYLTNFPEPSLDSLYGFYPSNYDAQIWQDLLEEGWDYLIQLIKETKVREKLPKPVNEYCNIRGVPGVSMRHLGIQYRDQLIELDECRVLSISQIEPYPERVGMKCFKCGDQFSYPYSEVAAGGGFGKKGEKRKYGICHCEHPDLRESFDSEHTTLVNSQYIKLQELHAPTGEVAVTLLALIQGDDDLLWQIKHNHRIRPKGLMRIKPIRNPKDGSFRYFVWFEIVHIDIVIDEERDVKLTEEDKQYIKNEMEQPEYYNKLVASFCPKLKGMEILKECGLLTLASVGLERPARIMLVGDPSIGKSEVLEYTADMIPDGYFIAMNLSSRTGLLTTSEQDKETNRWIVTPGLFPVAKVICIDEMQIGKPEYFGNLNSVIESGKIDYALVGGNRGTMEAKCALFMGCNPHGGRMKGEQNIHELLKFIGDYLPAFLTRLNLILFLSDNATDDEERAKVRHMLDNPDNDPNTEIKYLENWKDSDGTEYYGKNTLRKIIKYVTTYVQVEEMTEEDKNELIDYYMKNKSDVITNVNKIFNKRLVRHGMVLAQYLARLKGYSKPTNTDTKHILDLLEKNMSTAAFDPKTQKVDVSYLNGGKSETEREEENKEDQFIEGIRQAVMNADGTKREYFTLSDLIFVLTSMANTKWTDANKIERHLLKFVEKSGKIMEPFGQGRYTYIGN